jgi:hypothetical protein
MCTIFNKYASMNSRIDNCVPLQADNTRPVQVVIHLFKDSDEFNFKNNTLNDSQVFVSELNESTLLLANRDLSQMIKNKLTSVKPKLKLELRKWMDEKGEADVEIANIENPNRFFLHLANWQLHFNDMSTSISKDFKSGHLLSLADQDMLLNRGQLCIYVEDQKNVGFSFRTRSFFGAISSLQVHLLNVN